MCVLETDTKREFSGDMPTTWCLQMCVCVCVCLRNLMQSGPSGAGEAAIMCNVGGEGWRGADTGVANENDEKDTRLFISS